MFINFYSSRLEGIHILSGSIREAEESKGSAPQTFPSIHLYLLFVVFVCLCLFFSFRKLPTSRM